MREYSLTDLLHESMQRQKGFEALDCAWELASSLNRTLKNVGSDVALSLWRLGYNVNVAYSILRYVQPIASRPEPGVLGEKMRECEAAIEAYFKAVDGLRDDPEAHLHLAWQCDELSTTMRGLSHHIRTVGPY